MDTAHILSAAVLEPPAQYAVYIHLSFNSVVELLSRDTGLKSCVLNESK